MSTERATRPPWASLLGILLAAEAAQGQEPLPNPQPQPQPQPANSPPRRVGPIRRAFRGIGRAIHEDFIGDPDQFYEPPLGAALYSTTGLMRAKAEPHIFTLYRSDFLIDSTTLSPSGEARMGRISSGLRCWLGPVVIEATRDRLGLAEARRDAVIAQLQLAGYPVGAERVLVGPTVAPGLLGTDAANNYQILITRDQNAPSQYGLTPTSAGSVGGGNGGR